MTDHGAPQDQGPLRLIVMRHAKSAWDDPGLADHDRPLNARGRAAAPVMGRWLAAQGLHPGQVLTSSALRTRQTLAALDLPQTQGGASDITVLPDLYLADPAAILRAVQTHARARCVLILGHNPGLSGFASHLLANPQHDPRITDMPTCATLVATLPVARWRDVTWGLAGVQAFAAPRDLM